MSSVGGVFINTTQPGGSSMFNVVGGLPTNVPPSSLSGSTTNDIPIDLTGYTGAVNDPAGGPVHVGDLTLTVGANHAVFHIANGHLVQDVIPVGAMFFGLGFVTGSAILDPVLTSPALLPDLAPFATGGSFFMTYNGILVTSNGTNGTAVVGAGATASYTLTNTPIPEPATGLLAMSGMTGLGAIALVRRLRRKA